MAREKRQGIYYPESLALHSPNIWERREVRTKGFRIRQTWLQVIRKVIGSMTSCNVTSLSGSRKVPVSVSSGLNERIEEKS